MLSSICQRSICRFIWDFTPQGIAPSEPWQFCSFFVQRCLVMPAVYDWDYMATDDFMGLASLSGVYRRGFQTHATEEGSQIVNRNWLGLACPEGALPVAGFTPRRSPYSPFLSESELLRAMAVAKVNSARVDEPFTRFVLPLQPRYVLNKVRRRLLPCAQALALPRRVARPVGFR